MPTLKQLRDKFDIREDRLGPNKEFGPHSETGKPITVDIFSNLLQQKIDEIGDRVDIEFAGEHGFEIEVVEDDSSCKYIVYEIFSTPKSPVTKIRMVGDVGYFSLESPRPRMFERGNNFDIYINQMVNFVIFRFFPHPVYVGGFRAPQSYHLECTNDTVLQSGLEALASVLAKRTDLPDTTGQQYLQEFLLLSAQDPIGANLQMAGDGRFEFTSAARHVGEEVKWAPYLPRSLSVKDGKMKSVHLLMPYGSGTEFSVLHGINRGTKISFDRGQKLHLDYFAQNAPRNIGELHTTLTICHSNNPYSKQ